MKMLSTIVVVLCSILALGQPLPSQWWTRPASPDFQEKGGMVPETTETWAKAERELKTDLAKLEAQILNGVERTSAMAEHFNSMLVGIKQWEEEAGRNMTAMLEAIQSVGDRVARAEDGAKEVNLLRHTFLETRAKQNLLIETFKQQLEKAMANLEATQGSQADQLTDLKTQVDAQVDVIRQQHQALISLASLQKTVAGIQEQLKALKEGRMGMEINVRK